MRSYMRFGGFCCSLVYGWGIVFTRSVQWRRNQHLNFFLFFMALYVIILYGSSMFVSAFGNM